MFEKDSQDFSHIMAAVMKKIAPTPRQLIQTEQQGYLEPYFPFKDYMKMPFFCSYTEHYPHYTPKTTKQPEEAN